MNIKIVTIVITFILLVSVDTYASNSAKLVDRLSMCTSISNDGERLTCFDKLASNTVVNLTTEQESDKLVSQVKQAEREEAQKIADFSKEDIKKTGDDIELVSITGTISKLQKLLRGQWVISLKNGQKWQQTDTSRLNLKVGNDIRLQKGSLGSVYLFVEGSHRSIRVKRLK
jgi:hypothetical protein